jgi:hypothetical protein
MLRLPQVSPEAGGRYIAVDPRVRPGGVKTKRRKTDGEELNRVEAVARGIRPGAHNAARAGALVRLNAGAVNCSRNCSSREQTSTKGRLRRWRTTTT